MPNHSASQGARTDWPGVAREVAGLARRWRTFPLPVAAGGALVASAGTLFMLAHQIGWSWPVALTLPLTVDLLAYAAWVRWLASRQAGSHDWLAFTFGIFATVASIAGNTASHLISAGDVTVGTPMRSVVGAAPPIFAVLIACLKRPEQPGLEAEPERPCERMDCAIDVPLVRDPVPERPPVSTPLLAITSATEDDLDAKWAAENGIALDLVKRARAADCESKAYRQIKPTINCSWEDAKAVARVFRRTGPPPSAAKAKAPATIRQAVSA